MPPMPGKRTGGVFQRFILANYSAGSFGEQHGTMPWRPLRLEWRADPYRWIAAYLNDLQMRSIIVTVWRVLGGGAWRGASGRRHLSCTSLPDGRKIVYSVSWHGCARRCCLALLVQPGGLRSANADSQRWTHWSMLPRDISTASPFHVWYPFQYRNLVLVSFGGAA